MLPAHHSTHPQRGKPRGTKNNFMKPDGSSDSLIIDANSSVHTKSQGSIKTFTQLPAGAVLQPVNFGVKYRPAKLGLEYKLDCLPDQVCVYEVTLVRYIEQGMNTTQIVDLIFDLHRDFINPKVIARRQVVRLVDRLLTKAAPEILHNRQNDNKENTLDAQNSAIEGTPARPFQHEQPRKHQEASPKNLALQLNAAVADQSESDNMSSSRTGPKFEEPLLEQAPESERSDAFSLPISEGQSELNSARPEFNQVLNLRMSGKGKSGLMMSLGKDSVNDDFDNLEIGLDGEIAAQPGQDLHISEIRMDNQYTDRDIMNSGRQEDDMAEMEQMLKSSGAFGLNTLQKIRGEIAVDGVQDDDHDYQGDSLQQSGIIDDAGESDLDMGLHDNDLDNSKLLMDSPGPNTLQNQINQLNGEDDGGVYEQPHQMLVDDNGINDSQIDLENLTESQLLALQEQAAEQDFEEDGDEVDEADEVEATGEGDEEQEAEEDVIDVDNPEDLAKKGLRRIQIEGGEEEYLLDNEGNIYNLQGEFVGTTGDDDEEEGNNDEALDESAD